MIEKPQHLNNEQTTRPVNYRPDIDGLRAIAVMFVVLFHVGFKNFSGGFIGVDIFFVISGFLITRLIAEQIKEKRFSFKVFYIRRARRLLPALFFTLLITLLLAGLLFTAEHFERTGRAAIFATTSVSNFYFWNESGYFDASSSLKPLLHTWSLSVEEQFYLIWPGFLVLMLVNFGKRTVLIAISLLGLVSLYYAESLIQSRPSAVFYLAPFRIIEFSIGAILVWAIEAQPKEPRKYFPIFLEGLYLTGIGLILFAGFTYNEKTTFPGLNVLVPCIGAALAIYGGTAKYSPQILNNKLSVKIGLISYSLYLIHWPITVFYNYYILRYGNTTDSFILLTISVFSAFYMYRYIEIPFRSPPSFQEQTSTKKFYLASTMCILLIIIPSTHIWIHNGWVWRIPAEKEYSGPNVSLTEICSGKYGVCKDNLNHASHVIVGDSHAKNSYTFFGPLFSENNIVGSFVKHANGCKPFFIDKQPIDKCDKQRRRQEEEILKSEAKTIIFVGKWTHDISDNDAINKLISQLKYTANKLSTHSKSMVIFGQPPHHSTFIPACYQRPAITSRRDDCDIMKITYKPKLQERLSASLISLSQKHLNLEYIDNRKQLCVKGFCRVGAGKPFYKDHHHLSDFGERYILKQHNLNDLLKILGIDKK